MMGAGGMNSGRKTMKRGMTAKPEGATPRVLTLDKETLLAEAKMSSQEETACRELFEAYDCDAGRSIDKQELLEMLSEQNWVLDDRIRDAIIDKFCKDDDDINYDEFLRIYAVILSLQPSSVRKLKMNDRQRINVEDLRELEADCRASFEALDADGSGALGVDEMKEVLRMSGIPDLDGDNYEGVVLEHMRRADLDQDGFINFEEFVMYRNAVLEYYLGQSKQEAPEPDEPLDPWAWEHFTY